MKIKFIKDTERGYKKGDEIECSSSQAEEIIKEGFAEYIEESIKDLKKPLPEVEPILTQLKEENEKSLLDKISDDIKEAHKKKYPEEENSEEIPNFSVEIIEVPEEYKLIEETIKEIKEPINEEMKEKYYQILKAELEQRKFNAFIKDNLLNQYGFFIETYNDRVIMILSKITYLKKNPENYKEAWERWAEEQNKKIHKEYLEEHKTELIKIKFIKELKPFKIGEIVEEDNDGAKRYVKSGYAEYVKEKTKDIKKIKPKKKEIKKSIKFSDMPKRIKTLLESGKLWDYIVIDELDKKHKGDIPSKEVLFLCSLGKLVKNKKPYSFNVLVLDKSSAGKDNLVGSCLKLFPKDDYETYARLSSKSLNYLHSLDTEPDYDYNGKILYLKEITEEILNNEVMKEFTSGDEEVSKVAITKQKGGGIDIKEVKGHPCVFTTTATTLPTEETRNRFNIIKLDLSEEQTARTFIREEGEYSEEIKEFLANLKPYDVEIPQELFNFIVKVFPKHKVRYRRDFQRFLDFIKGVAIFHQDVRRGHTTDTIRAEPEDYNRAKDIFINAFSTCSDIPLKDIDERIIKVLEKKQMSMSTENISDINKISMSAKNILDELGGIISIQNLYPHLRNLTSKEILNEITDRILGYVVTNYVLSEEFKDKKPFILPNFDENNEKKEEL